MKKFFKYYIYIYMSFLLLEDLHKVLNTFFEENVGIFYIRKYNFVLDDNIKVNDINIGSIKQLLILDNLSTKFEIIQQNYVKKNEYYIFTINEYNIVIMDTLKNKNSKIFDDDIDNTFFLYYTKDKRDNPLNISFNIKNVLYNITKNKYVPYLELETGDIEKTKIAKIKHDDPLIKIYGFKKNDVVKIINKSKLIKNMNIYYNYRLVI